MSKGFVLGAWANWLFALSFPQDSTERGALQIAAVMLMIFACYLRIGEKK